MKGFIERLGLLFHWIGYIGSMAVGLFLFYILFENHQNNQPSPDIMSSFLILIAFLGSNTIGWVLRWLMVGGNVKFLPFDK